MQSAVSVRGLWKIYRSGSRARAVSTPALRDVTVDIGCGEIVGIVGRPGAGKSTLLLCLSGLLRADEGTVTGMGADPLASVPPTRLRSAGAGYYSFVVREAPILRTCTISLLRSARRSQGGAEGRLAARSRHASIRPCRLTCCRLGRRRH